MSKLMDKATNELLNLVGSSDPTPGGGSMSALAGAVAAQLGQMVFRLTEGKKSWAELDIRQQKLLSLDFASLSTLAFELTQLVDEDAAAYSTFMSALRLPKDTDAEKAARSKAMNEASLLAMETPMQIALKGLAVLRHLGALGRYGNKNCLSDVGVAAYLAQACVEGALLNVRINLPGIGDEELCARTKKSIAGIIKDKEELVTEVTKVVNERMDC